MLLVIGELFLGDLAALAHGAVFADLFERQQVGTRIHDAARDQDGRHIDAADPHQVRGYRLVTGGHKNTAVKRRRARVYLDHAADRVTRGERIVDAVMPLRHTVADIRGKIAGGPAARLLDAIRRAVNQLKQMSAARVAVAECALDHDLGLGQILHRPAHAHAQRVLLRRELANLLTYHTSSAPFLSNVFCLIVLRTHQIHLMTLSLL